MSVPIALFRIARPYYLMQAIAPPVAGYLTASQLGFSYSTALTIVLVYSLFGIGAWSVNEIYDKDFDKHGRTKKIWNLYVAGGTNVLNSYSLPKGLLPVFISVMVITALLLASHLNVSFLAISTVWILIGLVYSIPPVRLKERGFFGALFTASTYGFIGFNAGWLASGQGLTFMSLLFGLLMSIVFYGFDGLAHLIDYEDDRLNDIKTFAVELGFEKSSRLLASFQVFPFLFITVFAKLQNFHVNDLLIPLLFISLIFAILTISTYNERRYLALRVLSVPVTAASFFILI